MNKPLKPSRPMTLESVPEETQGFWLTRRDFGAGLAALVAAGAAGCTPRAGPASRPAGSGPCGYTAATETTLELLEVSGSHYHIGHTIGRRFASQIRATLAERGAWFNELKAFTAAQPASLYDTFVAAARKHAPAVWQELKGYAKGARLPLRDLVILNHKAELGALRDRHLQQKTTGSPGCSTVMLNAGGRLLLVHNEDGHKAYQGRMFMVRLRPHGQPSVLCACYPGVLPGNAPWVNDRGVVMTTNFIYSEAVRPGVGRYFLDRLAMTATDLDRATAICRHPDRAYAFHYWLGSLPAGVIRSLEVTPTRHSLLEPKGLSVHTNHLVHPALASEPQNREYVSTSSGTRWTVLNRWRTRQQRPHTLTERDLVAALALHQGKPYSPCRHPQGDVHGATLLTAAFDLRARTMTVYRGQPCLGRYHRFRL